MLKLTLIWACLLLPRSVNLQVPEDPQDPEGPHGGGFQISEDTRDLRGPEDLEVSHDLDGSINQDPGSPWETQDLNGSTKLDSDDPEKTQDLKNAIHQDLEKPGESNDGSAKHDPEDQGKNQNIDNSIESEGWAEPEHEGPVTCGELGGNDDCVDYNLGGEEVELGFDDGDGPVCGSHEYLEAGECVSCPVCGPGQRHSEPCGGGHEPSRKLHCTDCPAGYYSDGRTHLCSKCTDCSLLHRDVIAHCTRGNNTLCNPECWKGYEVRNVTLLNGIENMFACKKIESAMWPYKLLGSAIGIVFVGVAACCFLCARRRDNRRTPDRQVIYHQPYGLGRTRTD